MLEFEVLQFEYLRIKVIIVSLKAHIIKMPRFLRIRQPLQRMNESNKLGSHSMCFRLNHLLLSMFHHLLLLPMMMLRLGLLIGLLIEVILILILFKPNLFKEFLLLSSNFLSSLFFFCRLLSSFFFSFILCAIWTSVILNLKLRLVFVLSDGFHVEHMTFFIATI